MLAPRRPLAGLPLPAATVAPALVVAPRAGVPRAGAGRPGLADVVVGASGPGETSPGMRPAAAALVPADADVTVGTDGASAGAATPGTEACQVPRRPAGAPVGRCAGLPAG
jgi:hypothetical protein